LNIGDTECEIYKLVSFKWLSRD